MYRFSSNLNLKTNLQRVFLEQVRYRKRAINLKKPSTHFRREIVKKIVKPKYEKPYNILPIEELCSKAINYKKSLDVQGLVHPYDQLLGDEILETLMKSNVVAIFHVQPYDKDEFFEMQLDLNKIQFKRVYHKSMTIRVALQGTRYEPLLRLYEAPCVTFVSPDCKFSKLLAKVKKYSFLSLIGGIYDGRIINIVDFKKLAENPIETHHSMLHHLISTPSQMLCRNLVSHQQELCSSLQRYIDDNSSDS